MATRIYRRHANGYWYADFVTPEGKRVQRSLTTKDKTVARERARLAELAATPQARGRKQRLSEAIDHMITLMHDKAAGTVEMYQQKGRRIFVTLGDPFVHEITHDLISEYTAKRLKKDDAVHGQASPHTVHKELITIRRALKIAKRRGILLAMPEFPEFSAKYQPRETWLTEEQYAAICAELPADRVRWTALGALAGANTSEVEHIEWTKVDFVRGQLLVPGTKRETRRRWVPISPALRFVLELVPDGKRRGRVVEHWGNVRRDLHSAVDRANAKIAAKVKELALEIELGIVKPPDPIPKVSPNDLRRTFASWLVQKGVDLWTVAKLLGHSSTRMVEKVYGRLSKRNFEDAIAALPLIFVQTKIEQPPELGPGETDG